MRLDAAHQIGVVARCLDDRLHVDAARSVKVDIAVAEEPTGEIGRDEREDARLRLLDNEFAKPVEGQRARAALIHHRSHPGADADEIGVEPEITRNVLVDMGVGIDQAWRHDEPRGVDDLGLSRIEFRRDRRDVALADSDVADGIDPILRIDNPPALDDDVKRRRQLLDRLRHENSSRSFAPGVSAPAVMVAHVALGERDRAKQRRSNHA